MQYTNQAMRVKSFIFAMIFN